MMFMPPGSLVVEFVGHFENVHMPVCGEFLFGLVEFCCGFCVLICDVVSEFVQFKLFKLNDMFHLSDCFHFVS